MRNLAWKDVDLEMKQIIVRESKGKRPRTVPLNQKALTALEEQKKLYGNLMYVFPGGKGGIGNTGKWTETQKRGWDWWKKTAFRNIKEKIPTLKNLKNGRTGRNWHALRHTFATKLARAGIDIFKLKDWLGHKKMETTMRYIHLARHYDPDIELI